MSSINFDNVYWLFLAVPLVVLFTVLFVLSVRRQNANGHNIASYVMHIVLAGVVAFAAAGTSVRTVLTETDVYVVADVSYSASRNLDTVDAYIRGIELPWNSKLGIVCFGKDCDILYTMGSPRWRGSVKDAEVDDSETDIAGALEFTGELFRDDVIKRIVLITDGKQTDRGDAYAITRAVDGLNAKNIRVDAIWLDDNLGSGAKEVQISSVDYTRSTYLGRAEEATVNVQSTYATPSIVTIRRSGEDGEETVEQRPFSVVAGSNPLHVTLETGARGTYDYSIEIKAEGDGNGYNNLCSFTQKVTSELKVLAVTQSWTDAVAAVERYKEKAAIDVYYYVPGESEISLEEKQNYAKGYAEDPDVNVYCGSDGRKIPSKLDDLLPYDEIVLIDLDLDDFSDYRPFITNVDKAVNMFGKSLVTFGNLNIQTSADTAYEALGDMLPVRFGNSDHDPRLFTLVIDSSRSMEQLYKLSVAKKLAIRLLDMLQEGDEICIITFYGDVRMIQSPTAVTDNNRNTIVDLINKLTVLQGTVIGAGLQMAYDFIVDLDYKEKQVMLISDGLNYMSGSDNPISVASEMFDSGIYTSVIDVGRQGDQADGSNPSEDPTANRAKSLLISIANAGHGNYFYNRSANNTINDVAFAEISDTLTETVVEEETPVSVLRSVDTVLEHIDQVNIGAVSGYVYADRKPSANTVLAVNHKRATSTKQLPLYAYWQYGAGRVASFTSKLGDGWLQNWETVGEGETVSLEDVFLENVFRDNLPAEKTERSYTVKAEQKGSVSTLTVTPAEADPSAIATVRITAPDGDEYAILMTYAGDRFTCEFDCSVTGKYLLEVTYNNEETPTEYAFHYAYAAEYDVYSAYDPSELYKAVNGRGTVSLGGELKVENEEGETERYDYDLTVLLVAFAVALLVADIAVRKLKWEDVKSFFGFFRRKEGKKTGGNAS